MTLVKTNLKQATPTNHGSSHIPLLETYHPQRAGSHLTKIWGISNDLRHSDNEVGPDTTLAAGNIDSKPLLPHTTKNKLHESLSLPITNHPQEERINSLENKGISSSQTSTKNQGISNDSLQFRNHNLTMKTPPPKHPFSYKPCI